MTEQECANDNGLNETSLNEKCGTMASVGVTKGLTKDDHNNDDNVDGDDDVSDDGLNEKSWTMSDQ